MTEKRKKRVVRKGATYRERKKESRARSVVLREPEQLLDAVLGAPTDDPAAIQAALYSDIYMGGIDEFQADRFIYKPGRESLTELPPGILDLKEARLPLDLVPDRDRLLDNLLRGLILKTGIGNSLPLFTAGWSASGSTSSSNAGRLRWQTHVSRLFARKRDQELYQALVSGRFAPVIKRLGGLAKSGLAPAEAAALRRDLSIQALIWCCHDVQMVIARLAVSDTVFGPLVESEQVKLAPERIRRLLAGRRALIEDLLDLLYRTPSWRAQDLPLPDLTGESNGPLVHNPVIQELRQRLEAKLADSNISEIDIAGDVSKRIGAVAAHLRNGDLDLVATMPITQEEERLRSFSAVWFGGSKVAMAAVAVLRLIQAEHQIGELIDERVPVRGVRVVPRDGTAMPPFDPAALPGWRIRAIELLDFYRRTLLRDSDYTPGTTSREAIDTARDFLIKRGQRRIEDHEGAPDDPKRAFYLLDVTPEHRFALGSVKIAVRANVLWESS